MAERNRAVLSGLIVAYTVSLFGSQAIMSVGFAACVAAVLVAAWKTPEYRREFVATCRSSWGRRYALSTGLLLAAFFLSLLGAALFPVELGGVQAHARWGTSVGKSIYFVWPLLLAAAMSMLDNRSWNRIQKVWLWGFVIVSLFGIIEFFTGWSPRQLVEHREHSRFGGVFTVDWIYGSYLTYATVMAFPFFLLLEFAASRQWLGSRRVHLVMLVVGVLALFGTMSRMLWIALPAGLFVFLLLSLRGKMRWLAMISVVALLYGAFQHPTVKERVYYGRGVDQRTTLWKVNWELFKMRPLVGVGWHQNLPLAGAYLDLHAPAGQEKFVGHAHSNILEFLGGMGVLGLLAWICWSVVTAGMAYSISPGLFCAFIVFHLNGLTQVNFSETKTLHTVIWCVAFALASQLRGGRLRVDADKPA